jgi:ATP-dependent RNA helicase SUPV3L1/SUV3
MLQASGITALLGPTNTGKTHRAIERMLDHDSGMMGLPLRLLAREVYDRVSLRVGEARVALVTGEEKRIPRRPDYWVCTVEAMPVSREVDFLAVDEVQLAAHDQRGHVFTERLLHARGRRETWFMGSESVRGVLEALCPTAKVVGHPRLSRLAHVEALPLQRLPPRSAIVAFSLPQVYALAERVRVARGGAAVVLGALSPRARNAQVAMFEAGEVDYLVATDAIGMGLNLDVHHVAFASLRKFDGRTVREVDVAELAQIAGRAGRYVRDGTFGTLAPLALSGEVVRAIEQHRVPALRAVQWRSADLSFDSLDALIESLRQGPPRRCLRRVATPDDEAALMALSARPEVRARVTDPRCVKLLWEVCSIPDYRKLLREAHVELLGELFVALADRGTLAEPWLRARVEELDRTDGDVDTLIDRIAAVRTYTYVASQPTWVERAGAWQERTRAVEDRLSDALHAALVRRFVDQPGAGRRAAASHPRRVPEASRADVAPSHPFAALRALRDGMRPQLPGGVALARSRVEALVDAPYERFALGDDGVIRQGTEALARLVRGASVALPDVELLAMEGLGAGDRARLQRRLVAWTRDCVSELLGSLRGGVATANVRGVLYRLESGLGTVQSSEVAPIVAALSEEERAALEARGVILGARGVFAPALLAPAAVKRRAVFAEVFHGARRWRRPDGETVSLRIERGVPWAQYVATGYLPCGTFAVRVDVAERVHAGMRATPAVREVALARWLTLPLREARAVVAALSMP